MIATIETARHSTPRLTANTYTHLGMVDLQEAVNRLSSTESKQDSLVSALRATGTEDGEPTLKIAPQNM